MWHCAFARIQKRRHSNTKTTIVKLYICMNSCPQNKIDPAQKKSNSSKKRPCRNCIERLHYPAFAAFFLPLVAMDNLLFGKKWGLVQNRISFIFSKIDRAITFFEKLKLNPKKFDLHKIACPSGKNVYILVYFLKHPYLSSIKGF